MSDQRSSVAIVIPVHNRRDTTLQALSSLSRICLDNIDLQIFIVDDGSTDGTTAAIRSTFPDVNVIVGDGSLHYAAGTNRGISAALEHGVDFIVTANDDSIFHEQFLIRLLNTAKREPRSIVGAMLLLWDRPQKPFQIGFNWNTLAGGWAERPVATVFDLPRQALEVDGLAGNCVLIPAEAVRECGLLDERKFPHGWGDIQYFVRMRRMGWRLLVEPRAYVWCEPNTNPRPLHRSTIYEVMTALFSNRRHPMNLQRQFIARWESAPSKVQAVAAFGFYVVGLLTKSVGFGLKRV